MILRFLADKLCSSKLQNNTVHHTSSKNTKMKDQSHTVQQTNCNMTELQKMTNYKN